MDDRFAPPTGGFSSPSGPPVQPPPPPPVQQQPYAAQPYAPQPYAPQPYAQPYPQPYPIAPTGPTRRSTVVAVVVTAVVAGLVGALLGVAGTLLVQGLAEDPAPDVDAGRPAAEVLPERLPEVLAWVQERVGTDFTTTPEVLVLPGDEFEDALLGPARGEEGLPQERPEQDFTSTVTALGLVADAEAYDEYSSTGFADGVVGFYDPADRLVRLRGSEWGPGLEVTLVHELVHALQDQAVDLDAVTARTRVWDETYLALSTVVEGQATLVEQDWLEEQGEDYADRYWDDVPGGQDAYEPFGAALSWLPYEVGGYAVMVLEDSESSAATLEVLASPPTTLEQLWDVEGWRDGEAEEADPVQVAQPQPPSGLETVDSGSLGVHVLSMLTLRDREEYADLPYEDALPLQGWAGDAYVSWVHDDHACTRLVVVTDSRDAATAMAEELASWDADGGDLSTDGSTVVLERCSP